MREEAQPGTNQTEHLSDLTDLRVMSACVFAEIDNKIFRLRAQTEEQKSRIDQIFELIVNKFIEIRDEIHSTMDSELQKLSDSLVQYRDRVDRGVSGIEALIEKLECSHDLSVIDMMRSKSLLKDLKVD